MKISRISSQYINDDENDPHLLKVLCRMRQQLQQISYDADHSISAIASPYYLIVLSAGLGPGLRKAIEIYQPKSIIVAVQALGAADSKLCYNRLGIIYSRV